MIRRIIVLPQWEAEKLELAEPYAVISICNPGERADIPIRPMLFCVLRQFFVDGEPPDCTPADGLMQPRHGTAIAEFVRTLPDDIKTLVFHCTAAAGRSPSVAMAIADALKLPRTSIEWASRYMWEQGHGLDAPREYIYGLVREAMEDKVSDVPRRW